MDLSKLTRGSSHIDLHELIRKIRACKSAAEERKEISQEMANIRSAFKDKKSARYRLENVAKLMYLDMLGYQTYFGQMEVLKLLAMPGFPEKRVGYLGLMQLIDENSEILQLAPSTIKNDLENSCPQIVSLALTALGHICSQALAYDFATDIEKLLKRSPPQIRKKACLCACRIVQKTGETFEYLQPALAILTEREKYHGLRISAIVLIITITRVSEKAKRKVRKQISSFVRMLRELVLSSYDPDYDTNGVTDPFLQVSLLRLMRELAIGDSKTASAVADVLAQVATNTESNKNPGNAILYECVTTILSIEAESSLRVLAINILGRFLVNRDNNIRYVALNTLQQAVQQNKEAEQAIQRHRSTIVECIKDGDITIRRRALSLVDSLVNRKNVEKLVKELISFVPMAGTEFKKELCEKICFVAHRYSMNSRWHIETMCEILTLSGGLAPDFASGALIGSVARSGSLSGWAVHKLYRLLRDDPDEIALRVSALWCVGEFGEMLGTQQEEYPAVNPKVVITVLKENLESVRFDDLVKRYALTACCKLTSRFPQAKEMLFGLISKYDGAQDLELQSRSIEFSNLLDQPTNILNEVLKRLPEPPMIELRQEEERPADSLADVDSSDEEPEDLNDDEDDSSSSDSSDSSDPKPKKKQRQRKEKRKKPEPAPAEDNLLDLMGLGAAPAQSAPAPAPSNDLFGDLFGPAPTQQKAPIANNPLDIFSQAPAAAPAQPQPARPDQNTVFNKHGVTITLKTIAGNSPGISITNAEFRNSNSFDIINFNFAVAVPKYMKVDLKPANSNVLPPNNSSSVKQAFRLRNSVPEKPNVVKMKVEFTVNGNPFSEILTHTIQVPGETFI